MVTDDENVSLTDIPSSEKIFLAIKGMDLDSAPGPDGFNIMDIFSLHVGMLLAPM